MGPQGEPPAPYAGQGLGNLSELGLMVPMRQIDT